jgi:HNH endonuclease
MTTKQESFTVTEEWLLEHRTPRGAWNNLQVQALGWENGLKTENWKAMSVGLSITVKQKNLFEKHKNRQKKANRKASKSTTVKIVLASEHAAMQHMFRLEQIEYDLRWTDTFINSNEFLSSHQWKRTRMKALTLYGNVCECCGASPKTGAMICVDHIKPRSLFPHLALDITNLQILCEECNSGKGNAFALCWREGAEYSAMWAGHRRIRDTKQQGIECSAPWDA